MNILSSSSANHIYFNSAYLSIIFSEMENEIDLHVHTIYIILFIILYLIDMHYINELSFSLFTNSDSESTFN